MGDAPIDVGVPRTVPTGALFPTPNVNESEGPEIDLPNCPGRASGWVSTVTVMGPLVCCGVAVMTDDGGLLLRPSVRVEFGPTPGMSTRGLRSCDEVTRKLSPTETRLSRLGPKLSELPLRPGSCMRIAELLPLVRERPKSAAGGDCGPLPKADSGVDTAEVDPALRTDGDRAKVADVAELDRRFDGLACRDLLLRCRTGDVTKSGANPTLFLPVLTQRRGSFTLGATAAFPACGCSCRSAESTRSRIGGVSDSPSFAWSTRTHQFQKTLHVHCTLGTQHLHPSMQSRLLVGTAPWMQLWTRRETGS